MTSAIAALFATHYHERLSFRKDEKLDCYAMAIKEWESQIVFLHKVISGTADRSYGVHVARLAGLPKAVLERAIQFWLSRKGSAWDCRHRNVNR